MWDNKPDEINRDLLESVELKKSQSGIPLDKYGGTS
jgi:hypothetical protein